MSIEGQGHFFTIYFPGFVCFVLYWAKISGERLQDHWSSGSQTSSPLSLANQAQILCGASLGKGNESLYKWSRSHDQDGRHAHI